VFARTFGLVVDDVVRLTAINVTSGSPDQPTLSLQSCGT
jgi:hypothetical protein